MSLTFRILLTLPIAFLCGQVVMAQQPSRQVEMRAKQAVVIVTTYDDRGKPEYQASGFFITPDGIVTNAHVVKDAHLVRVKTFEGKTLTIKRVVAFDARQDLALLQTNAPCPEVTTLELECATPAEGESITVVSNPQGSQWKITRGQIGTRWEFQDSGPRISITAPILPGSSGGPVLNQQGRVIGIAVAHTASADDLNFAIPAESLRTLQVSARMAMPSSTDN